MTRWSSVVSMSEAAAPPFSVQRFAFLDHGRKAKRIGHTAAPSESVDAQRQTLNAERRPPSPHSGHHVLGKRLELLLADRLEEHEDEMRHADLAIALDGVEALLLVAD